MNAFDLVLLAILMLVLPVYGILEMRRLRARLAGGDGDVRTRTYVRTMALEWALAAAALVAWAAAGRPFASLGFTLGAGATAWLGVALGALACAALIVQMIVVLRSPHLAGQVRAACEPLRDFLPRDEREARTFAALSVTAGICEEILYRGFALAVLTPLAGTVGAVALTSFGFGLGHAYQGASGFVKTTAIGLLMAGLFLLSGSLWMPILLHAVLDLTSGHLGRRCLGEEGAPAPAAAAAG